MSTDEIWKDIIGYEGLYQVSNFGQVRSMPKSWRTGRGKGTMLSHNGKIRKTCPSQSGYMSLLLNKDGKEKYWNVHRLVAIAFIDNPEALPVVNHKDEDVLNNHVDNLEWCTQKYNVKYSKGRRTVNENKH